MVLPRYFHSGTYSMGCSLRNKGETESTVSFPNSNPFDFFTLNERQYSSQNSEQISYICCIAERVGARRQRSSAYIRQATKSDRI